jgi:hypothetical protein
LVDYCLVYCAEITVIITKENKQQQPLIAAGRGKPAINWWLVCLLLLSI